MVSITNAPLDAVDGVPNVHSIWYQPDDDAWLGSDSIVTELRKAVPLARRKKHGQFFTSEELVDRVWDSMLSTLGPTSIVFDPACGSGNLLIPAAQFLRDTYGSKVAANQLRGHDVEANFASATRARLTAVVGEELPSDFFMAQDYLAQEPTSGFQPTHVAMNPPFVKIDRPNWAHWANARTNAAAVFVVKALHEMAAGGRLLAILPDVLRSGSSYSAWREEVEGLASELQIDAIGAFDAHTDVDVFHLHATVGDGGQDVESVLWNRPTTAPYGTIGDHFSARVGSVVPHRTPADAPTAPCLSSRQISPWETLREVRTRGPVATRRDRGPFVVVRRTSSPRDSERVRASIVADTGAIGVENHLVLLIPNSGALAACEVLLENLRDPRTTEYMNARMRCRHLTITSVQEIPWWSADMRSRCNGAH